MIGADGCSSKTDSLSPAPPFVVNWGDVDLGPSQIQGKRMPIDIAAIPNSEDINGNNWAMTWAQSMNHSQVLAKGVGNLQEAWMG